MPKEAKVTFLNDYHPVAMKCFERLVMAHINTIIPETLDPLHTVLSHLDKRNPYVRMLFIDYSSAFNTMVPSKLITKLRTLGLNTSLCNRILDFLMGRPQVIRLGKNTSTYADPQHWAPPRSVLSPLLYSLFTYDCVARHDSNTTKFADDPAVVGPITQRWLDLSYDVTDGLCG